MDWLEPPQARRSRSIRLKARLIAAMRSVAIAMHSGEPPRDEAVGMIFGGKLAVVAPDRRELQRPADAENDVGIALLRDDMTGGDPLEAAGVDSEYVGDDLEIAQLRLVHRAVGTGDGKEAIDDVFEALRSSL